MSKHYPFAEVEPRWQAYWEEHKTFRRRRPVGEAQVLRASTCSPTPPAPGLHVGHPEGYTATDIVCRYKRMRGFNVLHPMGWDAFGLPAEQYAIKTGTHPRDHHRARTSPTSAARSSRSGFSYDWDREVDTTDPDYYRWTQWIFLQLFKRGLAYVAEVPVNWCPALRHGAGQRGGHRRQAASVGGYPVVRRPLRQWMLRITAYADRLLDGPGAGSTGPTARSRRCSGTGSAAASGAEVRLRARGRRTASSAIFTTRPDTLFGATYMVLAPEHPLVDALTTPAQRGRGRRPTAKRPRARATCDRTELAKEKTGVFTGAYAINPVNGEQIPIWIADYVLMGYGTGAIMAVPGARRARLRVRHARSACPSSRSSAAGGDARRRGLRRTTGTVVNSPTPTVSLDGLPHRRGQARRSPRGSSATRPRPGARSTTSCATGSSRRQRYWGEPFPLVHCADVRRRCRCPSSELPRAAARARATSSRPATGEPPAGRASTDWVEHDLTPRAASPRRRETNTMPQWAGSCWYYLRFLDPQQRRRRWSTRRRRSTGCRSTSTSAAPSTRCCTCSTRASGTRCSSTSACVQHARAVPEARPPGHDPRRGRREDVQAPRQRRQPRRRHRRVRRRRAAALRDVHGPARGR